MAAPKAIATARAGAASTIQSIIGRSYLKESPASDWAEGAPRLVGPRDEPLALGGDLDLRKLSDENLEQLRELYRHAGERRVWLEQLSRRLDPSDPEQRRLGHQLLVAVATNDDGAAHRAAAELSRLAGVDPPEWD